MQKALRHTVIIDFSHYVKQKLLFFGDLSQVFLNRILAPAVGAKDGTLTLRAVTLVHHKRFFGNKLYRVQHTLRRFSD